MCLVSTVVVAKFRAIFPSNGLVARSLARELARSLLRSLFESLFCTTAIITVPVTCTMLTDNDAAASLKGASIYDADSWLDS